MPNKSDETCGFDKKITQNIFLTLRFVLKTLFCTHFYIFFTEKKYISLSMDNKNNFYKSDTKDLFWGQFCLFFSKMTILPKKMSKNIIWNNFWGHNQ